MSNKEKIIEEAMYIFTKLKRSEKERALGILQGMLISKGNKILETLNNEPNNKKIA